MMIASQITRYAPAGTLAGVSGYQIHFSSTDIYTPGDEVDALSSINPTSDRLPAST